MAAEHLRFKDFTGTKVDVRGWPQEATDAAKDGWAEKYSDHALLYFEVAKVYNWRFKAEDLLERIDDQD